MLETEIKATIVAWVDQKSFRDGVNFARDTGAKIDQELKRNLEVNVAKFQIQLQNARDLLRKAKKEWDEQATIVAQLKVNELQRGTTEAKRQLNNLANTWDKDLSRLQAKFNQTNETIKSTWGSIEWVTNAISALWLSAWLRQLGAWITSTASQAGRVQQLTTSFKNLQSQVWENYLKTLDALRKATRGAVSDQNLLLSANKAQALWVAQNAEEFTTLIEIARKKWWDLGLTTQQAFDDLVTGLGRGSAMILDNLGIVVKASEAQEEYAKSVGKTVAQLTEWEKKQALINKVISDWQKQLEATGLAQETYAETQARTTASIQNLTDKIWLAFLPVLQSLSNILVPIIESVSDFIEENETLSNVLIVSTTALIWILGAIGAVSSIIAVATPVVAWLWLTIGAIATPVLATIAVVSALALAWKTNFLWIQEATQSRYNSLKVVIESVRVIFSRLSNFVKPWLDSLKQIVKRTVWVVVWYFDSLKWIGAKVKTAMDIALTIMTLWLNKLVSTVYKQLKQLDFVVWIRNEAVNNITRANTAESQRNNPNLNAPKSFDVNDIDFSKVTKIAWSWSKVISNIDNSWGWWGWWGWGWWSKVKKEVKETNVEFERLEKQLERNADRYKELWRQGTVAFDAIGKAIDDSGKNIDDLNSKLWKTQNELGKVEEGIAWRVISIEKELEKLWWALNGDITDKERNHIERKQKDLQEELALASKEVNQETLDELNRQSKLSETEKLLEKKWILSKEEEELKKKIEMEENLNKMLKDKKIQFLEEFTDRYWVELVKQEDLLKQSVNKQIAELRRLQSNWWQDRTVTTANSWQVSVNFGEVNINNGIDEQQFYDNVGNAVNKAVRESNLWYN